MPAEARLAVILPYGGTCPHRERALSWVRRRWEEFLLTWQVYIGRAGVHPWCKAEAVAAGLAQGDEELIVVADADVWSPGIPEAVHAVLTGAPWSMPHGMVHRLDEAATRLVLTDGMEPSGRMECTQRPYLGFAGGGIVVLRRADYAQVPLDRRFRGWGQEDESWSCALHTMLGNPWRGTAPLYHLWHPMPPRMSRRHGSTMSMQLSARYRAAMRDNERMRALLEEAG